MSSQMVDWRCQGKKLAERAGVEDAYLGIDDLKFPRAVGRLVLCCTDEGDEGCAEEHLDDTCCALVIYAAVSASGCGE